MGKSLRSPLKWYGGKQRLVKKLIPLIPEHQTYVEAFAGGAALFFAKPASPVEVINDIDSGIVNFFRVLRDPEKFERFRLMITLSPYSREEHELCRTSWQDRRDDVERARRWFVTARQSFGGVFGGNFSASVAQSRRGMAQNVSGYLSAVDRLPQISQRLLTVQLEHLDFRDIIRKYDRTETFFYLDPPYVHSTRTSTGNYVYEMTDQDHEELVELLLTIKGKALLSGYANPIYERLETAGWKRHDFATKVTVTAGFAGGNPDRVESVWLRDGSDAILDVPLSTCC